MSRRTYWTIRLIVLCVLLVVLLAAIAAGAAAGLLGGGSVLRGEPAAQAEFTGVTTLEIRAGSCSVRASVWDGDAVQVSYYEPVLLHAGEPEMTQHGAALSVTAAEVSGLGSLLAFPGSMIGALLCGLLYRAWPKLPVAYVGEVFGTGILGGMASYPIAAVLMNNSAAALFTFVPSFLVSTAVGAAISVFVLAALKRTHVFSQVEGALR